MCSDPVSRHASLRVLTEPTIPPPAPAWEAILAYVVLGPWFFVLPAGILLPPLLLGIVFFPMTYYMAGLAPLMTGLLYTLIRHCLSGHGYLWQMAMGLCAAFLALLLLRVDIAPLHQLPPASSMLPDKSMSSLITAASLTASPLCACFLHWGNRRPRLRRCIILVPLALMLALALFIGFFLMVAAIANL